MFEQRVKDTTDSKGRLDDVGSKLSYCARANASARWNFTTIPPLLTIFGDGFLFDLDQIRGDDVFSTLDVDGSLPAKQSVNV